MTNAQTEARAIARRLWKEHGGAQHGPHTETLTMPLDRFNGFVDALIATALAAKDAELAAVHQRYVDANEARIDAEAALAEARKALEPIGYIDPADIGNKSSVGELLIHWCCPEMRGRYTQPVYTRPSEQAVTEASREEGMKLTREQAQAFIDSLFPNGEYSWLHNPTRTYFSALIGDVPHVRPYSDDDPQQEKLRQLAGLLRQIADHIEISGEAAQRAALQERNSE